MNLTRTAPARRFGQSTGVGLVIAAATVGTATTAHAQEVEVRPGDTVSHIALRTGSSVAAIRDANGLDSRATIRAGQRLTVPEAGAAAAPVAVPAAAPTLSHTVVAGDTVSGLALTYGTTTATIVAANGLDARATIRIGQVLAIGAAAAAAPVAAPAVSHTVVAGDTVSGLALSYGTSTAAIVAANGLNARATIRIGQVLAIGTAAAPAAAAPTPAATPAATPARTHTVVAGDAVSRLASTYATTTGAIVAANGLDARAVIRIGQVLTIPGGATTVGNTFAGRTYADDVVAAANANLAALRAAGAPSKADIQSLIIEVATQLGVDPALAQAVSYQESGFNHAVVSPANAIGAMQVIPTSGQWASELVGRELNLLDPRDNVTAGVAILRHLVAHADDQAQAIAGYYQGLAGVRRHGMYDDTRRYVASVQTLMGRYA